MIDPKALRGIVPPMVTPFEEDGHTVSEAGVHRLMEWLVSQGVHGIFAGGTTGEMWALDDAQWSRLVRFGVAACRTAASGRSVPFYAGVSHPSTGGAVARARQAERLGADVVVSLAPYYIPPSQAHIVRHFKALASATGLPVLIYQYPGIVKTSITLETYRELAECPGIVGVKDSQADVTVFRQMVEVLRAGGSDFRLFLGTDTLTDVTVLIGAQGTVPSLGNVAGAFLVNAFDAACAGDWAASAGAQAQAAAVQSLYTAGGANESQFQGVIGGLKCALNLLGVPVGPPAPPLRPCNEQETGAIAQILRTSGLLS